MTREFEVDFYYDVGGSVVVKAKNEKAATDKIYKILNDSGVEGIKKFDTNYRQYDTNGVREIGGQNE